MLNKSSNLSLFTPLLSRIFVSSNAENTIRMKFYHIKAQLFALLLTALFVVCGTSNAAAQGWEIYFGGLTEELNYDDFGESIISLADGGYLVVGASESFGDDNDIDIYAIRLDADGEEIWSQTYDEAWQEYAYKVKETSAGNFIIAGFIRTLPGDAPDAYFLEIDAYGNLLWSNQFGGAGFDVVHDVTEASDGGYVFVGQLENEVAGEGANYLVLKTDATGNAEWVQALGGAGEDIARSILATDNTYFVFGHEENTADNLNESSLTALDADGTVLWNEKYAYAQNNLGYDLALTSDGNLALTGWQVDPGSSSDAFLLKVDIADGSVLWQRTLGDTQTDEAYGVTADTNGDLVVVGITEIDAFDIDVMLTKYDTDGNEIWFRRIGRTGHVDFAKGLSKTLTGGYILTGYNSLDPLFAFHDVTVIRTDSEGNIFSNYLQGKVFFDADANCTEDDDEAGLNEWIVIAEGAENTFYGSTDAAGNYSILADTGTYDVRILPKNSYWESCVELYNDVQLTSFYDTTQFDFALHPSLDCPLLNVDVSAPAAQNCVDITYTVSYCNDGTATAQDPYIELFLDEEFTFNNATLPVTAQTGNQLTFNLPNDLAVGECGSFSLSVAADCNSVDLTTYTMIAHIYPDLICSPPSDDWDMSSIEVSGVCETAEGEVVFNIKNVSDQAMSGPQEFVIIEDHIMIMAEPFDLGPDELVPVSLPITGATYRIIAEQSPGHPGNSYPTVAVEGCALDGQEISTGTVTSFPEDEADAFVSADVQQIGNEATLTAYPTGYPSATGDSLLIATNTQIQYHFSFENTTEGVVNRVVIRDTLPTGVLDAATFAAGAASHAYTTEIYEGGIVKFIFSDMYLLPTERAFVQFKINQKTDLPAGTEIANQAKIYLEFEEPYDTERVVYHVGGEDVRDFVTIDLIDNTIETFVPNVSVNAYPNPFTAGLTIDMQGTELRNFDLKIYDESGRLLRQKAFAGSRVHLLRGDLPTGVLLFRIESNGQTITTGKAVVK